MSSLQVACAWVCWTVGQALRRIWWHRCASLFSVPIVSERVRMLFEARNVDIRHHRVLSAIDPGRRIAVFSSEKEGKVELPYDFINVIPPMCAPDVVKN